MRLSILTLTLFLSLHLGAQQRPTLEAIRTDASLKLDGSLDEPAWQAAEPGVDFTTLEPVPGKPASEKTEVRVLYDNKGIYFGAMLYDARPDSILTELTERDDLGNTDFFGISIDAYNSGQNGFTFITTPAEVQFDAQFTANQGEDPNWDAVWVSKSARLHKGWSTEVFIPYSALRFPSTAVQSWTINFVRQIQRKQEKVFWSAIDPNVDGYFNQSGKLEGLRDIKAPLRIQATPFVALYALSGRQPGDDKANTGTSITGGMDLKVGLNEAFTLDMTLIPDFGEARSDDQILNLGPFEQRFDEQRAFFTEGTELFNKGGFFYSRRVGGANYRAGAVYDQQAEGEEITDNPGRATLYNAFKITGRTAGGTGVGFFNAIEQKTFATLRNTEGEEREVLTNPLTNYNVAVVDQNLPNNSSVTLINTNVLREGNETDANVTGLLFDLHNKENKYSIRGEAGLSQRFLPGEASTGHKAGLSINKISGNWTWTVRANEESDTYDPNDLGLLFANNERSLGSRLGYNYNKPFLNGFFLNGGAGAWAQYATLYTNEFTNSGAEMWVYAQTKHFWNVNFWVENEFSNSYDYFEPRVAGRYLRNPAFRNVGGWFGTDKRKAIRFNGNFNTNGYYGADRADLYLNANIRYRVSDKLSFNTGVFRGRDHNEVGYVHRETVAGPAPSRPERTDIYMGRRDVTSVEGNISAKYSFNANMTLNLRLRHYWSGVRYNRFSLLGEDGELTETDYQENHDRDFDAFNVDLIYRWRFAPGSDIFLVYKSSVTDFDQQRAKNYGESFGDLWGDTPRSGSVSLKAIYWLDYASLRG